MCWLLTVLAALLSGCASVSITLKSVASVPFRAGERDQALDRWREAVWLCNAFLTSSNRTALPEGKLRFTEDGMEFVTADEMLPVQIRCTAWGDLLVGSKFTAQERADGFVVGFVPPKDSRLLDNSFFKNHKGEPWSSAVMAETILHELTHSYHGVGTVSFSKALRYYAEAVFLFRYERHSMEKLPFETTRGFWKFYHANAQDPAFRKRLKQRADASVAGQE